MLINNPKHEDHRKVILDRQYRHLDLVFLLQLFIDLLAYHCQIIIREEITFVGVYLREALTHAIDTFFDPLHTDIEVLREFNHVEAAV